MKQGSRSFTILLACVAIYYFFTSCSSSKFDKDDKSGQLLANPIKIIGYDISNSSLKLKDNHNHDATYVLILRKQIIDWNVIGNNVKKLEIVSIYPDPNYQGNSPDFFDGMPAEQGNPKHWRATIGNPDTTKLFIEKYNIRWRLTDDTTKTYTYDPIMQINPK